MTETETTVRIFYSALSAGEVGAAIALLDKAVRWTEAERTPYYTGEVIGGDAVFESVLGPLGRDFENFAATPLDFLTEGDRTVVFGLYTGKFRSSGGELRAPFVHLWTVRDGMIVDFSQYTDSAGWTEAILGSTQTTGL